MMTKTDLIALLAEYPDDTPILDGRGYDLRASSINETTIDDWDNVSVDDIPGTAVAIAIGPRF